MIAYRKGEVKMASLKSAAAKSFLNLKVVEDSTGLLVIGSKKLQNHDDTAGVNYTEKIVSLLSKIKGIDSLGVDYNKQVINIKYQPTILNTPKINKYIDLIIDVVVENLSTIQKCQPEQVDALLEQLNTQLNAKVAKVPLLNS